MDVRSAALAFVVATAASAPQAAAQQARQAKVIPALPKPPQLDGKLTDFLPKKAMELPKVEQGKTSFVAKVAHHKTTLYLGVEISEDQLTPGDTFEVMMHFPDAGVTAEGHRLRFGIDGRRNAVGDFAAPRHSQERVNAAVFRGTGLMTFEIAIPAEAFPRFPASEPLLFDLCLTYEDRDDVGDPVTVSNCTGASMGKEAVKLPDAFRKALKLKPPQEVVGLQRRPNGWIGYGIMHYPIWAYGDSELTQDALEALVTDEPVAPQSAGVALPRELVIGKTRLFSVLSGQDPYAHPGRCNAEVEVRMGLYAIKGRTADRVLEWPAASCALGRASVSMDDDGDLTVGYSNGATVQFAWTGGKFQRTEIGRR